MSKLLTVLVQAIILSCLLAPVARAGGTAVWEPNTEADMSRYNLYVCVPGVDPCVPDSAGGTGVQIDQLAHTACTATECRMPDVMLPGTEGTSCVTAVDTSSNEGDCSNTAPFDLSPPSQAKNYRVE